MYTYFCGIYSMNLRNLIKTPKFTRKFPRRNDYPNQKDAIGLKNDPGNYKKEVLEEASWVIFSATSFPRYRSIK